MTAAKPRLPYTYDDYRTLPEDMSRRYELLHGDLYMAPAPTTLHQRILGNLYAMMRQRIRPQELGEVFIAPLDVILGQGDAREVAQPDLMFVAASRLDIVKLHGIEGPPELVVEILSPGTEDRDRGYKLKMYARHGVLEYWIINPVARTLDLHKVGPSDYLSAIRYGENDDITCELFRGLNISLQEIFAY